MCLLSPGHSWHQGCLLSMCAHRGPPLAELVTSWVTAPQPAGDQLPGLWLCLTMSLALVRRPPGTQGALCSSPLVQSLAKQRINRNEPHAFAHVSKDRVRPPGHEQGDRVCRLRKCGFWLQTPVSPKSTEIKALASTAVLALRLNPGACLGLVPASHPMVSPGRSLPDPSQDPDLTAGQTPRHAGGHRLAPMGTAHLIFTST